MKPIQRLSIYVLLTIVDGIILAAMFFLMLEVVSGMAYYSHFLWILFIVIASSMGIQAIPTVLANRYLTLSSRFVMSMRYAYIIPYSLFMVILARVTSSYILLSMISVVLFITYLKLTSSSHNQLEDKRLYIHHTLMTSLIFFISFVLTLLSVFIR
jgi:hypothetical protein